MNSDKRPGIGKIVGTALTWVSILNLLMWLFGWLLERKWGLYLILWALWYFGAMIILGGALSLISGDAGLADETWPLLLFAIAAAVMTGIQLKACEK